MRLALSLHPESRCAAATGIDVDATRPGPGELVLRYAVTGAIGDLRLPPAMLPTRVDDLWKHTCFEAFIAPADGAGYFEFNVSPSLQWAAYRFSGYREGMAQAENIAEPDIELKLDPGRLEIRAHLCLPPGGDAARADWRVGLSAVIEEKSGVISHWALAHPPGKADFHHADAFTLSLPAGHP